MHVLYLHIQSAENTTIDLDFVIIPKFSSIYLEFLGSQHLQLHIFNIQSYFRLHPAFANQFVRNTFILPIDTVFLLS